MFYSPGESQVKNAHIRQRNQSHSRLHTIRRVKLTMNFSDVLPYIFDEGFVTFDAQAPIYPEGHHFRLKYGFDNAAPDRRSSDIFLLSPSFLLYYFIYFIYFTS